MRILCRLSTTLALVLAASCGSTGRTAEANPELMMQRWAEFMTPGPAHQALAPRVGNWNMKVRMFAAPGAPPDESAGTSNVQWVMDGRFLQDTTTGEFAGQTFHGLGFLGYDNLKKAYVGTWLDNFGTGVLYSQGHFDEKSHTFHYESSGPDLMFTNAYVPTRSTEKWIDADHWVLQNFSPGADGEEFLSMEIEYARVK